MKGQRETSAEVGMLCEFLSGVAVGEIATYADMNALVGRDLQNGANHMLQSARRRVLSLHGAVFDAVPNVGMKRLDDVGVAETAERTITHVRKMSRRELRRQAVVDAAKLSDEQRQRYHATAAVCSVLVVAASPKSQRVIGQIASAATQRPALVDSLDAIRALEQKRR